MSERNELVDSGLPGMGHNMPPLSELLNEETAELKKRATDLVAAAGRAIVTDRDSAEKATLLVGMMKTHGKAIETARETRKAPFLANCREVDRHFGEIRTPLIGADGKRLGGAAANVQSLIDDYYAEEERKAEVERRRLEEEAQRKHEEAEAAELERLAAEEKARRASLAGDVTDALAQTGARVDAEVRQRQLEQDAARLKREAALSVAGPINTGLGVTAHRRVSYHAEITDLTLAIRHARRSHEAEISAFIKSIYDRQVRAGARTLPGAKIVEVRGLMIKGS